MSYKTIELIMGEGIAFVYLNRPNVLNALNETMRSELIHVLKVTEEDDTVRVLIMTGRGRGFCAGADVSRFVELQQNHKYQKSKSRFGSVDFPRVLTQYPKPIIAAINGPAYGGGFTMTLSCDIRLASERAKFSCPFVRIGITPELCSSYFLPRLLGYGKAAELVFTTRPFDAHEALEIGAVNHVFPHNRLMGEARKIARQIASMPAGAVRKSKELLRHGMHSTLDQVIQHEAMVLRESIKGEEHQLGLQKLLAQMKLSRKGVRCH